MADDATVQVILQAVDQFSGVFGDALSGLGGLVSKVGELGVASAAFGLIGSALESMVTDAEDAQLAQDRLNATLEVTGRESQFTISQLNDMAQQMASFGFGTLQAEQQVEALMLRMDNITADEFPKAVQLSNDMAAAMGTDVTTAGMQLARALETGLIPRTIALDTATRAEITSLMKAGDAAQADDLIMQALSDRYGGMADKLSGDAIPAQQRMQNSVQELGAEIGKNFLPLMVSLDEEIQKSAEGWKNWFEAGDIQNQAETMITAFTAATGTIQKYNTDAAYRNQLEQEFIQIVQEEKVGYGVTGGMIGPPVPTAGPGGPPGASSGFGEQNASYGQLLSTTLNLQKEYKSFNQTQSEVIQKMQLLDQEKQKGTISSKTYQSDLLADTAALDKNKTALDEWAKQFVFSTLQARLGAQANTKEGTDLLIDAGEKLGVISPEIANVAKTISDTIPDSTANLQDFQQAMSSIVALPHDIDFYITTNFSTNGSGGGSTPTYTPPNQLGGGPS